MRAGDESFEHLRAAIEHMAGNDVAQLVAEAQTEARARVRSMLTEAMAQAMLERVREQIEGGGSPRRQTRGDAPPGDSQQHSAEDLTPPARGEHGLGWYMYGVTTADGHPIPAELRGIDPAHAVTSMRDQDLAAIVSRVPLAEFDEERLREHLADMAWLERTARQHEAVLDAVRALRTVIPMRLCSIYRDDSGIRTMLRRESEALRDALESLDGKAEWGMKVFLLVDPETARPVIDSSTTMEDDGAEAGAAYMKRRGREHRERRESHRWLEAACTSIHERLAAVSVEGLMLPVQRREASDHAGEMILNGVYLVDDGEQHGFHAQVSALQAEFEPLGLQLEPTGPWPAYNFVPGTIGAAW